MTALSREEAKNEAMLRLSPVAGDFPFFAGTSLLFGLMFAFCLHDNPCGITYPLFVLFACACGIRICRRLSLPIKKGSWFLLAAALLLGLSTFYTADPFLHCMNSLALVLLGAVFALHQFYEEQDWNIGKYMSAIMLYFLQALGALPWPFCHASSYKKETGTKGFRLLLLFLAGFSAALPVCLILTALLCQADAVFSSLVEWLAGHLFSPAALLEMAAQAAFGSLALYCLVCSCCLRRIAREVPNRQCLHPAIAITCLSSISLVYLLFCAIQVFYLFLGRGSLPEGYTYASYARQGFFQLLWVASFNLAMVLCCLKYVRPHKCLRLLLTLVCLCTFIMLASAAYRMLLYVQQYHLTYLRVLVLWFLALLFVLMSGVCLMIWIQNFRLVPYCVAAITIFYVGLAWLRPDSIVAQDYVSRLDPQTATESELAWLSFAFSADAAPAAASLGLSLDELRARSQCQSPFGWYWYISRSGGDSDQYPDGLRTYNASIAKARELFGQ
ncbi:DUF4173 domain-containing protein [Clostridiaceae bacterium]|nr:DUF4173 domain-containing protein [Clostridiaceae bacterium]RKI12045.1 DUF4173 domain-containing protein [bacterium 1XD21-70]